MRFRHLHSVEVDSSAERDEVQWYNRASAATDCSTLALWKERVFRQDQPNQPWIDPNYGIRVFDANLQGVRAFDSTALKSGDCFKIAPSGASLVVLEDEQLQFFGQLSHRMAPSPIHGHGPIVKDMAFSRSSNQLWIGRLILERSRLVIEVIDLATMKIIAAQKKIDFLPLGFDGGIYIYSGPGQTMGLLAADFEFNRNYWMNFRESSIDLTLESENQLESFPVFDSNGQKYVGMARDIWMRKFPDGQVLAEFSKEDLMGVMRAEESICQYGLLSDDICLVGSADPVYGLIDLRSMTFAKNISFDYPSESKLSYANDVIQTDVSGRVLTRNFTKETVRFDLWQFENGD